MASDAFGVGLEPFGISPDPRFIYFDPKLRREHHVLLDRLRNGSGLTVITGEHGVGKTMLLHCLAAELDVADHLVVYISCLGSPSVDDIMGAFAVQIGYPGQIEDNGEERGRDDFAAMPGAVGVSGTTAILLLDDADRLSPETLAALSAMTRGDSKQGAALAIVLAGLPSLASRLDESRDPLPRRKLGLHVALTALEPADAQSYVYHRLHMAGYGATQVFTPEAIARVTHHARGNPQAINRICRAAMIAAAGQSRNTVSEDMVDQAAPSAARGRAPKMARARREERSPPAGEGLETVGGAVMSADARARGIPSGLDARSRGIPSGLDAGHAHLPLADGGETRAGDLEDGFDGADDASDSAMPSGRDLTEEVATAADAPRLRAPSPWRKRWAALGALAVVGAAVLYVVASVNTTDLRVLNTESPPGASVPGSEQSPSEAPALEALLPGREAPPFSVTERLSPLEPEKPAMPESWGSPLEKAVFLGDIETVAALLDDGADINAPVAGGGTLLVLAAENGDEAMVSYLIGRGADPSFGTIDGANMGANRLFPDADVNTDATTGEPEGSGRAFSATVGDGDASSSAGPDANSRGGLGRDLLLTTTEDGAPPEAAREEATMAADPERPPKLGLTPLIAAAQRGHADVVGVLLAAGAKVNVADTRGRTPLMAAVEAGDAESVSLLLARNADVLAVDDTGRSALDMARQGSRWDLVRVISARAEPTATEPTATESTATESTTTSKTAEPAPPETTATRLSNEAMPPVAPRKSAARKEPPPELGGATSPSTLQEAQDRARVIRAQMYLSQLGYDPGPLDGVPGSRTRSAILAFQRNAGAAVDGRVTDRLLASLAAEANARQARRMAAETPAQGAPPRQESLFNTILSRLQSFRGLDFNSVESPGQLKQYCGKNRDTWVYDKGTGRSIFCAEYMRRNNL